MQKCLRGGVDQFNLTTRGIRSQDVDITLHEFSEPPFLRSLSTIYFIDLYYFKWLRKRCPVVGIISAEGESEVISQTHICNLVRISPADCLLQFFPSLHHLKDQIQIIPAFTFIQILNILQNRGKDSLKTTVFISFAYSPLKIIPKFCLGRQVIICAFYWCNLHTISSSF